MIIIVVLLAFSVMLNLYFIFRRLNTVAELVVTKYPDGKKTLLFDLNVEPDDIRIGETYTLKVVQGTPDE